MEYRITFYQTEDGQTPVVELLESLRTDHSVLHKLLVAGLRKLKLRVGRTDIARVFFFFRPNQEIVCTNGYVKKSRKLDPAELARAERYKADWERRYP